MIRILLSFLLGFAAVAAVSRTQQKIVGGSATTIYNFPSIASLLYTSDYSLYQQSCAGIIINARSILTAANCPLGDTASRWRVRVGSTSANSGGVVHSLQTYIMHYSYYPWTRDNDIAIMRTSSVITYNNAVQAGRFAGANYNLDDNQAVLTAGWGRTSGPASEQLRYVQVWTINQATCVERYRSISETVTDNMLCSGWLDVGGHGQCQGDYGGPLYHNNVVVGVYSWGEECGLPGFPAVSARVSRYTSWIQANA